MFPAPIPGQSLTTEPKNYPWERTPEISKPEEAALHTIENVNQPKKIEAILDMLELGIDLVTLTEGILRNNVTEGMYSIDVSILIAPVIHEFLKGHAERSGIEYDEGINEEEGSREEIEYTIRQKKSEKLLKKFKEKEMLNSNDSMPEAMLEDVTMEKETMSEDIPEGIPEGIPEDIPEDMSAVQGLMSRQGSVV